METSDLPSSFMHERIFSPFLSALFSTPTSSSCQPLDRDPPSGRAHWRLRVSTTDGKHYAHTDVLVNLKDVNDNAPYFSQPILYAAISEDTPQGTLTLYFISGVNGFQEILKCLRVLGKNYSGCCNNCYIVIRILVPMRHTQPYTHVGRCVSDKSRGERR